MSFPFITVLIWIYRTLREHQKVLALVIGPVWTFILMASFLNESWEVVISAVAGFGGEAGAAGVAASGARVVMEWLALANYVFPLDVLALLLGQLLVLLLVAAGVRSVKAFVPTIA